MTSSNTLSSSGLGFSLPIPFEVATLVIYTQSAWVGISVSIDIIEKTPQSSFAPYFLSNLRLSLKQACSPTQTLSSSR